MISDIELEHFLRFLEEENYDFLDKDAYCDSTYVICEIVCRECATPLRYRIINRKEGTFLEKKVNKVYSKSFLDCSFEDLTESDIKFLIPIIKFREEETKDGKFIGQSGREHFVYKWIKFMKDKECLCERCAGIKDVFGENPNEPIKYERVGSLISNFIREKMREEK